MSLRTGGREAVEDTPVTGATQEQIEAAAFAALADYFDGDLDATNLYWQGGDGAKGTLKTVDQWAEFLVPVGYVIVRAEDALTDGYVQLRRTDVEALLRIADLLNNPRTPDLLQLIERLREDIAEG